VNTGIKARKVDVDFQLVPRPVSPSLNSLSWVKDKAGIYSGI
jgi:hypothetical protein